MIFPNQTYGSATEITQISLKAFEGTGPISLSTNSNSNSNSITSTASHEVTTNAYGFDFISVLAVITIISFLILKQNRRKR